MKIIYHINKPSSQNNQPPCSFPIRTRLKRSIQRAPSKLIESISSKKKIHSHHRTIVALATYNPPNSM